MNQFKSGTLLVIAATFIIAIFILMTDRDKPEPLKTKNEIIETAKTEVEEKVETETSASIETKEVDTESVETKNTEVENISKEAEKVSLIAPEPQAIAAPEGPYSKSDSEEVAQKETEKVADNVDQTDASIKAESINAVATLTQHDLLNHLIQPIWMDQKLGDFKSVENGEVVFKIMPTTPKGLQGEDPQQVVTDKSDKFAPTTISADFNYQQMPIYNGGYYIAPMPPYLMESMLPISEPVKAQ